MDLGQVKLLGTWSSPYVLRVVWALRIKGVQYEYVEEDLKNKSDLLLELNPVHKKVPVLIYNGKPVLESGVILEFIDEAWQGDDGRRILPQDPYDRAAARVWARFGDDKLSPPIWRWFTAPAGEERDAAYEDAVEQLRVLDGELGGKRFFAGDDRIGLVDLALGPLAYVIPIYEEITGVKLVTEEKFPSLFAWMKNFLSSPVVKDCLPPMDELELRYRAAREAMLLKNTS